jgi:hypothetical protein
MSFEPTCSWQGQSGQQYQYWATPIHGFSGKNEPGNYILAQAVQGSWRPIYIGECQSLRDRCCKLHEKWDAAIRLGATHIHTHTTSGGVQRRLDEETDLRRRFNPPLNKQ